MKVSRYLLQIILLCSVVSCRTIGTEPTMSFEEAKHVVLSMQGVPMVPPPRKMEDILTVLKRRRDAGNDQLEALIRRAEAAPPDGLAPRDLYHFYKSRAQARYALSRLKKSRADFRTAIQNDRAAGIGDGSLNQQLAELEMIAGRYDSAMRLTREATGIQKATKMRLGPYRALTSRIYQRMGNFSKAEESIRSAKNAYARLPRAARLSLVLDGGALDIGTGNNILAAEAELLEAQGRYDEAHPLRASVFNYHYSKRRQKPFNSIRAQMAMANNLMGRGRPILAEREAREAVQAAVTVSGRDSSIAAAAVQTLAEILLAKGDLENAGTLSAAQLDILSRLGLSDDEDIMVRARLLAARVSVAGQRFPDAMAAFDLALKGMAGNPYFLKRYTHRNHGLILSLVHAGRLAAAEKLMNRDRRANWRSGRTDARNQATWLAMEAMALGKKGQIGESLEKFFQAVPGLVESIQNPSGTFEMRRLADSLLNVYIDMLLELYHRDAQGTYGIDVAEELFQLTEAQHSKVTSALGENIARAASLTSPVLAELVRKEQDAGKKIKSLKAVLFDAAASENASGSNLAHIEGDIEKLAEAKRVIARRIKAEYPEYRNYLHPPSPSMARVQAHLAPGEAFVSIWSLARKTCVWAIPHQGKAAFAVIDWERQDLKEKVQALRKAMEPDSLHLGDLPEFDLKTAHELYRRLLRPVAPGWQQASDLIVAVKGPMDQIPLAVLPMEPATLTRDGKMLFENYRQIPWLIKKVSMARVPSATSLVILRNIAKGRPDREPFAGFGDPVFNAEKTGATASVDGTLTNRGGRRGHIAVRGIRVSDLGSLDSGEVNSVQIEDLSRLSDTASEISEIAKSLGADPAKDVFLGKSASETRVKTEDLSRKRILAFATHALVPGDLNGLTQPALAFSSPEVTGQDEDGLLTLGEILTLNLDADLVVLSACDTGAGDGSGGEAISGLGRAFFYAGARALLVTMWPVETTSAKKLTTGIFHCGSSGGMDPGPRALRRSIIELINGPGLIDEATGLPVARYAHPFFWAPFVMVGQGAGAGGSSMDTK